MTAPIPDPAPEQLRARYDDVVWHENTHELSVKAFAAAHERVQRGRGWGTGALVRSDGKLLLVRQDGRWYAPGGILEADETPAEGAVREVREETGVDVRLDGLAAIAEQTFVTGDESFVFYFALFDATPETTALTDDPGIAGENISSVEWCATIPENTYDHDLIADLFDQR